MPIFEVKYHRSYYEYDLWSSIHIDASDSNEAEEIAKKHLALRMFDKIKVEQLVIIDKSYIQIWD